MSEEIIDKKEIIVVYAGIREATKGILYKYIEVDKENNYEIIGEWNLAKSINLCTGIGAMYTVQASNKSIYISTGKYLMPYPNKERIGEWRIKDYKTDIEVEQKKKLKKINNEDLFLKNFEEAKKLYQRCTSFERTILIAKIIKYIAG